MRKEPPAPIFFRMSVPAKVALIGSGNWASAVSRMIGVNVLANPAEFAPLVHMYTYEETLTAAPYAGRKLSEIINTEHENVKYLPKIKLPENIVAVSERGAIAFPASILGARMKEMQRWPADSH